jgi:hypothetical protein
LYQKVPLERRQLGASEVCQPGEVAPARGPQIPRLMSRIGSGEDLSEFTSRGCGPDRDATETKALQRSLGLAAPDRATSLPSLRPCRRTEAWSGVSVSAGRPRVRGL